MKSLKLISATLVIVGAINWGLVGVANLDLVYLLLGSIPFLMKLVYVLVGLSGLYMAYDMFMGEKKDAV
jgi:uncharacterized membrane protein YuzA (DUF378 family)